MMHYQLLSHIQIFSKLDEEFYFKNLKILQSI